MDNDQNEQIVGNEQIVDEVSEEVGLNTTFARTGRRTGTHPQRRRRNLYHPDEIKQKIAKGQILRRLILFCNGKIEMSPHQVTASLGLLRKAVPDLSATEVESRVNVSLVDVIREADRLSTTDNSTQVIELEEEPRKLCN